jgi:pimeloyl-ACP methyl ester carboxylesterase
MFIPIRKLFSIAILCILCNLAFAASPYASFFQQYEDEYRLENPYVSHQINRQGYQLHAREFGASNSGPTVIMMHGFPDTLHLYDLVAPKLATKRHVVVFDFLGWGESEKPIGFDYTVAEQVADLDAIIDHFNLQQVILVMHDASGPPAIDWALKNKNRLAGLVLLNTYYSPMQSLRLPEAVEFFATPGPQREQTVEQMNNNNELWLTSYIQQLDAFFSREKNKETFTKILAHQSLAIRPAFFSLTSKLFSDVATRADRLDELTSLDHPVRIIFGAEDPYLNIFVATQFFALFPQSELFLIRNAGHFVQLDKPNRVAALIADFLNEEHERDDNKQSNHD